MTHCTDVTQLIALITQLIALITLYISLGLPLCHRQVLHSVYPSDSYSTEPSPLLWPGLFSSVLIPARVPGFSLCLALLDIVRRSQTYACPKITLCLAINIPVCQCVTHACFRPCLLIKPCRWIRTSHVLFAS